MFSNTAYEAMYQYLGLELHAKFIEVITSQKVFSGVLLLIFGFLFFLTALQFFSRYVPGALIRRRHVPLSQFVKIVFCLFIGIAFLKVGTKTSVKKFNGESWDANPYIKVHMVGAAPQYKVSFLFDIISRTAEEVAALISRVVDQVFGTTHSQLDAPNFFFKAIMFGGAASIDDPALKKSIKFYTEECFDRIMPLVRNAATQEKLDGMFRAESSIDQKLSQIALETPDKRFYTCLDVKNEVRDGLKFHAAKKAGGMDAKISNVMKNAQYMHIGWANLQVSDFLVNYYIDQHEGMMGVQKGSQLPTTTGRIAQYLIPSWDRFLSVLGLRDFHGATLAASRSQEFSENLARAPHVAGFIKMLAIALFPWLIFFVVAGYWRIIIFWFLIYFSVLLWEPIWTLVYHIMVNISLSADTMAAFGRLNDGISLYSADLITSRIYHLFAAYSWLQLLTGTLFTGMILFFIRPALTDTESAETPEIIGGAEKLVNKGSKVAGAVL